jgi:hypothetical protein
MTKPLAAEVFQVGIGGPVITHGPEDPSTGAGYPAAKGSQYIRDDGIRFTKTGAADTDWLPPVSSINAVNGDSSPLVAGMPVVLVGALLKRANASSVGLSAVIGIVFQNAGLALPANVIAGGPCTLTTAQWDAITGQSGGLTPSATYWLGTSVGTMSTSPPSVAGQSVCVIGRALSATALQVALQAPILL